MQQQHSTLPESPRKHVSRPSNVEFINGSSPRRVNNFWTGTERQFPPPASISDMDGTAYDEDQSFFSTAIDHNGEGQKIQDQIKHRSPLVIGSVPFQDPLQGLMEKLRIQEELIKQQKEELASKEQEVTELRQVLVEAPLPSVQHDDNAFFRSSSPGNASPAIQPFIKTGIAKVPPPATSMSGKSPIPSFSQYRSSFKFTQRNLGNVDEEATQDLGTGYDPIEYRKESVNETLNRPHDNFRNSYVGSSLASHPLVTRHESWHGGYGKTESNMDTTSMPPPPSSFSKNICGGPGHKKSTPIYNQVSNHRTYGGHGHQSTTFSDANYTNGQTSYQYKNINSGKNSSLSNNSGPAQSEQRGYPSRRNSTYSSTSYGSTFGDFSGVANSAYNRNSWEIEQPSSNRSSMLNSAYLPTPIGTHLSPTATEFTSTSTSMWNTPATAPTSQSPPPTYISPVEPLDYRRLVERSVNCDWRYIVENVVTSNDQQASIFLQQKLKIGTSEQKHAIVDAIVEWACPLMVNRFGNFLVQRCFEHGDQKQIDAISQTIKGKTLQLSMDAFGCHVVQKALDYVDEPIKATMVHELLRRIPETVVHRYACHVWQKLFELRWTKSPPQIMNYVNEALHGQWTKVALGETGSLVVQNIFENCLEEDKRSCINEVLHDIDLIAHGQFGNWCIQHICEHGAPNDRDLAVNTVLQRATEYSMDQFASKVVEKCLKVLGVDFLERYLDRVCEGRQDRPRIPLIDIASDQYGNYLIQYILSNSSPYHRDIVAAHIRKHMVSLRGSKFGSRVGMLCCGQGYHNRPATQHAQSSPLNQHRYNNLNNRKNPWGYRNHNNNSLLPPF